ncbi:MAG TPA: hypothetical protein VGG10_12155 [Rhizomicrobium sp.]
MSDRDEASALLNDVQGIETRVRQLIIYARISDYLFLWGAIWLVGYTGNYFLRSSSNTMWLVLQAIGLAGTVIIARYATRRVPNGLVVVARAALSVIAVVGFGSLWIKLLGMGWREQVTFWPTLLSFILFLIGLWAGRALSLWAVAVFALSLTGYFVAGNYLHLWMAVAVGGAMLAGGFWLRR